MEVNKSTRYLTKVLVYLGLSPKMTGYKYVRETILINIEKDCLKMHDVYTAAGQIYGKYPKIIESSIRNTLKQANNNGLGKRLDCLMGVSNFNNGYNITVSEFLGLMSDYMKHCWDGESFDLPELKPQSR